jgi:hypothetical protein
MYVYIAYTRKHTHFICTYMHTHTHTHFIYTYTHLKLGDHAQVVLGTNSQKSVPYYIY